MRFNFMCKDEDTWCLTCIGCQDRTTLLDSSEKAGITRPLAQALLDRVIENRGLPRENPEVMERIEYIGREMGLSNLEIDIILEPLKVNI